MASVDSAAPNGHVDTNGTSAQKLMQQHDIHNPTIEDEVDEADLKHSVEPTSSSVLEGPGDEPAPGWAGSLSAKAAGKRKEESPKAGSRPNLDPTSEELFPVLGGGPKPTQPVVGADWRKQFGGASSPASTNGTTNGAAKSPTPTPAQQDPRKINIPGQVREEYTLQKTQILSRQEMKKPLRHPQRYQPEIQESNCYSISRTCWYYIYCHWSFRRSRSTSSARRCLSSWCEGRKKCLEFLLDCSNFCVDYRKGHYPSINKSSYHWKGGLKDQGDTRKERRTDPYPKDGGHTPSSGRR